MHMDDKTSFNAGAVLLTVLLIETILLGNTFGLQWHSPKLMYQISAYLLPLKLLLTALTLYFLIRVRLTAWRKYLRYLLVPLGVLHIVILSLVCLAYLLFDFAPLTNQYQSQGNIAVFTANPGAMGKAYHYFSYICHSPLDFYTLEPITRLNWLGKFEFSEQAAELIIQHTDNVGDHETRVSLAGYSCG
jgi:hypothetical protein